MTTTVTFDSFQAALVTYADAKAAGSDDAALVALDTAIAIRAGLPDSLNVAGGSATIVNMAQLLALRAAITDTTSASASAARGRGRVIGVGVSHGSGS